MLDLIRGFFRKEYQLGHIHLITGHLAEIMEILEDEYIEDPSLRNAAIDAIVKLIQEYKEPQLVEKKEKK